MGRDRSTNPNSNSAEWAAYPSADYPGPPDFAAVRAALDAAEKRASGAGAELTAPDAHPPEARPTIAVERP